MLSVYLKRELCAYLVTKCCSNVSLFVGFGEHLSLTWAQGTFRGLELGRVQVK